MIRLLLAALALLLAAPAAAQTPAVAGAASMRDEVIYHVFLPSYADANGDRFGDLAGLTAHLDDIKALGATSILLTPLQPSPFYHKYFATDFAGIDPAFGTMADFTAMIRAAHARGLRVYLDQEIQYVADGHPWLEQARGRPGSRYGRYILWNRPKTSEEPVGFLNVPAWPGWDGKWTGIAVVDLGTPAVRDYFRDLFVRWIDPHGDGSLRDGVDGFRIDHMMDDLDNMHRLPDLFASFWRPIFAAVRARNPDARIIAEQADWGYGDAWLTRGDADMVFAFPLRAAIAKMDKAGIVAALAKMAALTPANREQIVFAENHDTDRIASALAGDPRKARIAAALTLLTRGVPLIYYGQELGMTGKVDATQRSDAAHIPLREAYRWQRDETAPGAAIWYRAGARAVWTNRYNREAAVSLAAEQGDPASLYGVYRRLLALRAARPELRQGVQTVLCTDATTALCLLRQDGIHRTLILANLGDAPVTPNLQLDGQWQDADTNAAASPAAPLPAWSLRILTAD